jgi:phosphoribosylformylglycinamidine synthase
VDDDVIVLLGEILGEPAAGLGGSEYLVRVHELVAGAPPDCDPTLERDTIECLLECIRGGHVHSAHDCSDGGLGVALAECAIADRARPVGAEIDLSAWRDVPLRALLYNEAQARIVVTLPEASLGEVARIAIKHRVAPMIIGRVRAGSPSLTIKHAAERTMVAPLERLAAAYHEAIPAIMEKSVESAAVLEQAAVTTV